MLPLSPFRVAHGGNIGNAVEDGTGGVSSRATQVPLRGPVGALHRDAWHAVEGWERRHYPWGMGPGGP